MKTPGKPDNETDRLDHLNRLDILDTSAEDLFDDFTRLASMLCRTLFSTVSIIDDERQWFKSVQGPLGVDQTSRDVSFCGHAILQNGLFIVEDAIEDQRFNDNPLVTGGPMIRFYAGAPLITSAGFALGTLCVFDPKPGKLDESQQEALKLLAGQVVNRLEQRMNETLIDHVGTLMDVSNTYILMVDPRTERVSYMNDGLTRRLPSRNFTTARELIDDLFPELGYDQLLNPPEVTANSASSKTTTVRFHGDPNGKAELQVLSHLSGGRHHSLVLFHDKSDLFHSQSRSEEAEADARVFSSVAAQSKNSVIVCDIDGRIKWANKSFEHLTGYTASEVMGEKPGDFLQGPDTAAADRERIGRHLARKEPVLQEILNYSKSGEPYWIEIYVEPVFDNDGRLTHFVSSQSNVTRRKEQDLAIRASKEEAEESNRAKSQFLANISHELRTPLNGIMGLTENLMERVPDNLKETVKTLDHSSRHLLSVLNDILDLSQIESGYMTLVSEPFSVEELLSDVESLFSPQAKTVGTDLKVEFDDSVPRWLVSDATRLRQILMNLVSNAVKFTHKGEIVLSVRQSPDTGPQTDSDLTRLEFCVRDTGPGISLKDQERIFENFEQLDNSSTRVHGGTGLGLAISRQLVKAMGGDISIESEPGKGTALKFTLRFPRSDTPPAKKTQFEPGMRTHFEISHALVVDDNEINRRILTDMLERSGIGSVYTAPSARRALALLRNLQPDVVFIDLHMPEMDGFQLLEEIKKELGAQGRAMPLTIACTADVGNNKKRQCLNAGFDVHFGKPITGERLSELLNCIFWPIPITDSGLIRSPILELCDH
jgi:PAS domain S-box-containing protein